MNQHVDHIIEGIDSRFYPGFLLEVITFLALAFTFMSIDLIDCRYFAEEK